MAERIQLIIDVLTGNASGPLSKLKTDLAEADGAFAKTKVAASGLWDNMKAHAGTAALAAGAALTSFAVKAVGDFQDTALGAGKLRDSLGITADEASRLQEVAGDLGIGVGTLEKAMGMMSRAAENAPEKFDALGAAIERNRDGSVDVTGTFLNVIDALKNIKDPAERAARAQELLGRSWMDASELIEMGAKGVRTAMAEVEDAKIIDDKEIETARKFRDTLDDLKGVVESASVTIGGELVPVLTDAAETLEALAGPLQKVHGAFDDLTNTPGLKQIYENFAPWEQIPTRIRQVNDMLQYFGIVAEDAGVSSDEAREAVDRYTSAFDEAFGAAVRFTSATGEQAAALQGTTSKAEVAASTQEVLAAQQDQSAAAAKRVADALQEETDKLTALIDAAFSSADSTIALEEAQEDVEAAIRKTIEAHNSGTASAEEMDDAVDGERDSIIKAAGAARDQATAFWEAHGATISATDEVDTFNGSLLNNARNASPAAQQAIVNYIAEANRIPAEKATEILAAIRAGDIPRAQQLLNETSKTREAAINVDDNGTAAATDREINNAARARNAVIRVITTGANAAVRSGDAGAYGSTYRAGGGSIPNLGGENVVVGENGPEMVRLPVGAHVYKENETRNFDTPGRGGDTFNIYGTTAAEVVSEIQAIRWRESAVPTPGARR